MNGLLRDYFPKGTDLSVHSPEHLLAVENELNERPRQVLNGTARARASGHWNREDGAEVRDSRVLRVRKEGLT